MDFDRKKKRRSELFAIHSKNLFTSIQTVDFLSICLLLDVYLSQATVHVLTLFEQKVQQLENAGATIIRLNFMSNAVEVLQNVFDMHVIEVSCGFLLMKLSSTH